MKITEYSKELVGLLIGSFGILFPIVTGMWTYTAGMCVGVGLMLICFNMLDFCVCKKHRIYRKMK